MHRLHFRSCPERYENLEALATPTLTADTLAGSERKSAWLCCSHRGFQRFTVWLIQPNDNADTDRLGLGCYFSFSYKASDVGLGKPHPQMFERALQSAGVEPSEALHIGDSPVHDIFGASAVGMHRLHFRSCPEGYENLEALATPTLTADTLAGK